MVELDIAFGKLDWEGHGEIVAGYEFGSPQDRLLVMTTGKSRVGIDGCRGSSNDVGSSR